MTWIKTVLTRVVVGEIVHFTVKVANPETKVDHLLVVLVVFFVTTALGVTPDSDTTGDPR
ncbi:hypothetical protein BLA60_02665 [Actinophytocola xinjiangensis]|uniref:Uncharacterized protein n=1 Tax=Actinophytocola xinjiangensis TaxID=485602 RepID=A0A7Z0WRS2_9PSEU|nr:hypothetical protein [Actinophytocola xinjiangensis]OLF14085.1 hypothetical protein BLA60_02665 [Actinophytocola xinjiangensis]